NDAINKVEDLFTDGTHTNIKDSVNQNQINVAQAAVDKLPDGSLKDELQALIDKAQKLLY
ncbi:MAG: toxin Cry1Ac domain D-VI-related protein, partial [Coprobacillaceae bacterium]